MRSRNRRRRTTTTVYANNNYYDRYQIKLKPNRCNIIYDDDCMYPHGPVAEWLWCGYVVIRGSQNIFDRVPAEDRVQMMYLADVYVRECGVLHAATASVAAVTGVSLYVYSVMWYTIYGAFGRLLLVIVMKITLG